jgi:hypothetical protein
MTASHQVTARPRARLSRLVFKTLLLAFAVTLCAAAPNPARAATIEVHAGGDLQLALNNAQPGDVLVLEAGATFAGEYTLPVTPASNTSYITVRSSRCSELPAGVRVSPAAAPLMARLATRNVAPALLAPVNTHHWRFECLEFTQGPTVGAYSYTLIELGDGDTSGPQDTLAEVPHHFEIDRCIIRARDSQTAAHRGVALHSAHATVKNSHISDIKWEGTDTQAVIGWNGPGPFLIENNYLEAAGINVLFGGATPATPGLVPSDITIRNNHLFKPMSWKGVWTAKNLLELKSARRVRVEGNVLENSWPDAQTGWAVIFNVFGNNASPDVVEDVEFTRNVVRNVSNGINLRGMEPNNSAVRMRRVRFADNLLENVGAYGGEGKVFQLLNGTEDVRFDHNTVAGRVSSVLLLDARDPFRHDRLAFTNNVAPHGSYGVFGNGGTLGSDALARFSTGWSFAGNVIAGADARRYPPGNLYPPTFDPKFFADPARGNYRISHPRFKGRATDGKDPGCDFERLEAALAWYARPAGV